MVGEIRDEETAKIAIECALTGHLVLSTLHSVDAISTVTRLLEMGVKPYLLKATLSLVVAQRLAKLNCPHCLTDDDSMLAQTLTEEVELSGIEWKVSRGCEHCHFTGLKGRRGLYESLHMNSELSECIQEGVTEQQLRDIAERGDNTSLADHAVDLARDGKISAEEYVRLQINS
jgi:type II secretory ATPase GspE/PulE/Tfp pilus assembly ATPase PilB-like protein